MTARAADWDMSPYFSAPDAEDYRTFRDHLDRDIEVLATELASAEPPAAFNRSFWAERLISLEDLSARRGHLSSYLGCMGAADARDELIKRESARFASVDAAVDKLYVLVRAALGRASEEEFEALLADDRLAGADYFLRRLRQRASWSMEPELEALAADLSIDGIGAWGRLYDQVSGTLTFELAVPGRAPERHPVAMTRTMLEDADPVVRRAAFDGAAEAWESVADTVAASLNAISGTRHALYARRGVAHFLEPALFDAGIERRTLDAMFGAVRKRQDLARSYLQKKAELLGMERLGFCDLMAALPVASGDERIPWDDGVSRVQRAFGAAYPNLADLSTRALRDRWIDHSPRDGKRPGGFCSSSHVVGQSRIFMTYNGAMGDVQTLAHELGHAFHGWLMRDMRTWSRRYPMTLAETASTFAENLVTNAVLRSEDTSDDDRLAILDTRLQDAEAFLLNIPMRFDFEHAVYERRPDGELSVHDFQQLMLAAQRDNYGDALDPEVLDPWFWASKLHFYITDVSFYNFPYTFGYLFSMGLFARYLEEGAAFLPRYEELLRTTGSATAEEVAERALGVDLGAPDFWNASIDLIEADWKLFESLAAKRG